MKYAAVAILLLVCLSNALFALDNAPSGLMCELIGNPELTVLADAQPEFSWVMQSDRQGDFQLAYQVLVASNPDILAKDKADVWDSGKVVSAASISITYEGDALRPGKTYFWKVRTWNKANKASAYSALQKITMANNLNSYATSTYPLQKTEVAPAKITQKSKGQYLVDFGKVAFGYLQLELDSPIAQQMEVHFGERGNAEGIIKELGGTTVRYYKVEQALVQGINTLDIRPPQDQRNTHGAAVKLPKEIGVIAPFRYVELVNCPVELKASMVRQVAVHYRFDETASSFESSDPVLNAIWHLCKYSMKATSFCGVYVDGDRERIPYEGDAYINQLSHYAVDREYSLARYSHEYLLKHPTWPIEWSQHSVFMAWTDYMYTGDKESLAQNYDVLKEQKTQEFRARADGLLNTGAPTNRGARVVLDWPMGERDGYQIKEVNTVVNAFYYQTLLRMADMAAVLGKDADAAEYQKKAAQVKSVFNQVFFAAERGLYIDAGGTDHVSLHANMMPLAFGMVPLENQQSVADYVVSRGMACSVYGAQYLLEGLYNAGRANEAFELLVSKEIRSWYNMLRVGSTITLEAWDDRFKPNQDWNHAWGAVPGNIIPRYLLGVRPLKAGFSKVLIRPMPGPLERVESVIPTIRGPLGIKIRNEPGKPFELTVSIPANMTARVEISLPDAKGDLTLDGKPVKSSKVKGFEVVENVSSGSHQFRTTAVVITKN